MSLADAFAALKRGEAEACLAALAAVDDTEPAVLGRVFAYRAQALRHLGRIDEAERAISEAIRFAKRAGETEAVLALREVQKSILASVVAVETAKKRQVADRQLLQQPDTTLDAEQRLRKASLLLDEGEPDAARALLSTMEEEDPRLRVLILLSLARCSDPSGPIHEAHRIADLSGDHNLITAVAQAAKSAKVKLKPPSFG